LNEQGLIKIFDRGSDAESVVMPTRQCVHCGGHFVSKPARQFIKHIYDGATAAEMEAQGKTMRGWCMNCNGPVCGPACAACVPVEQMLENMEKGRSPDHKPIVVSFSKGIGL
jgi:hypothetical protein